MSESRPRSVAAEELADGRLESVLAGWVAMPGARLFALHPHRRFVSPSVRAFIDTLREEVGAVPRARQATAA